TNRRYGGDNPCTGCGGEGQAPLLPEGFMRREDKEPKQVGQLRAPHANYFQVGHNGFEFPLASGQFYPASTVAQFHTRIVTSPVYAKVLSETLRGSIDQYEQAFGVIPKDSESSEEGG